MRRSEKTFNCNKINVPKFLSFATSVNINFNRLFNRYLKPTH